MSRDSAYRIKQNGMVVARVECREEVRAHQEIMHYAVQYARDGEIVIERRDLETGRWRRAR